VDVTAFITQIRARNDNSQPLDADYSGHRTRILEYLIEEFEFLWTAREWSWRRTSANVTVPANQGYGDFPSNYQSIGRKGGVWNTANGKQLRFKPEDFLRNCKILSSTTTADPDYYSEYGQNASDYTKLLQTENNSETLTLLVAYNKKAPDLDDTTNTANLNAIPEEYHQSVLIPAVRSLAAFHRGDADWAAHEARRMKGLDHMIRTERKPQDRSGQFPSFFGGSIY
jgi:hypothetical protein